MIRSPGESRELRDEGTGARVLQITSHASINHHLYPLTCSTTPDTAWVVFASNRTGKWQFFRAAFPRGEIVQLTDHPTGVHGYSGHLTRDGSELIYTAAGEIRAVEMENGRERTIARWEGASLGEVSLNTGGDWIVTAMKWNGRNYLAVAAAGGPRSDLILELARTIIHPQFHPTDDEVIEYAQDPAPRMWLIGRDGSRNRCLYDHDNDEFILHETWLGATGDLVFTHWPYAIRRIGTQPGSRPETLSEFNAWHIAANRAGTEILCDTNHPDTGLVRVDVLTGARQPLCAPGASCGGSQWRYPRYAVKEDFERAGREQSALSWMESKTDTVYGPQWTHPHPSWSADERWCLYDSDVSGSTQVYAVALDG